MGMNLEMRHAIQAPDARQRAATVPPNMYFEHYSGQSWMF